MAVPRPGRRCHCRRRPLPRHHGHGCRRTKRIPHHLNWNCSSWNCSNPPNFQHPEVEADPAPGPRPARLREAPSPTGPGCSSLRETESACWPEPASRAPEGKAPATLASAPQASPASGRALPRNHCPGRGTESPPEPPRGSQSLRAPVPGSPCSIPADWGSAGPASDCHRHPSPARTGPRPQLALAPVPVPVPGPVSAQEPGRPPSHHPAMRHSAPTPPPATALVRSAFGDPCTPLDGKPALAQTAPRSAALQRSQPPCYTPAHAAPSYRPPYLPVKASSRSASPRRSIL